MAHANAIFLSLLSGAALVYASGLDFPKAKVALDQQQTSSSSADVSGLRVTVKKVDFYPDRVDVVVTFANLGDGFVTLLPYAKSVLRDDRGGVYRVLATKD